MLRIRKSIDEVLPEGEDGLHSFENIINSLSFRDLDEDDLVEGVTAVSLQEVESRLIQLDPSIQDTMWYV